MGLVHHRSGSGEPLVLVHGVGSRWQVWQPVIAALAASFEVVAVDLPGFGASAPDGTVPSVEAQAERLEAFFAEEGLGKPHVAGNSMGGGIALELARRGSVLSATAVSPVGFWSQRERAFCIGALRGQLQLLPALRPALPALVATPVGRTLLFKQLFGRPWKIGGEEFVETVDAFLGSASTPLALERFNDHVFHDAEQLDGTPVTIAWGTADYLLLHRQSRRARRVLPRATHIDLVGCGHVPFADDPELLADVLLRGARA